MAQAVYRLSRQGWIKAVGGKDRLTIRTWVPWRNGYSAKSYQRGEMRDELLNGEIFYSLREAQIIIEKMDGSIFKTPNDHTVHWVPAATCRQRPS